ncbi:hypothetical protein VOLCADRAFT_108333 [Volvox carteri f. nagariensis]|uniref:Sulfotransferase n=1 Tax=Volvox carteri f. nagariensis TaxID=3068 RepID=D8UJI8_VOLCA|nr:uncharacterized protein VOLCADRAFT_108333 [Volvox carteri f. nagariensis]EFJ40116.1 hypothetical protein VOLCADRAFT_108333 [Volvox carteri f. nagariensis]|eukprot:XP_002958812.1 hypothetical protein VOLCADRAFT_108333 [Volvox carteri f. nagariensis]
MFRDQDLRCSDGAVCLFIVFIETVPTRPPPSGHRLNMVPCCNCNVTEWEASGPLYHIVSSTIYHLIAPSTTTTLYFAIRTVLFLSIMAVINTLLSLFDWVLFSRAVSSQPLHPEPLFILGHPRSGTTHLHNLLATDPRFAFATTFHAGFPSSFLTLEPIRGLLTGLLERRRPMDNMALHWDLPAEDEIAVNVLTGGDSPYLALVFPRLWRPLLRNFLDWKSSGPDTKSKSRGREPRAAEKLPAAKATVVPPTDAACAAAAAAAGADDKGLGHDGDRDDNHGGAVEPPGGPVSSTAFQRWLAASLWFMKKAPRGGGRKTMRSLKGTLRQVSPKGGSSFFGISRWRRSASRTRIVGSVGSVARFLFGRSTCIPTAFHYQQNQLVLQASSKLYSSFTTAVLYYFAAVFTDAFRFTRLWFVFPPKKRATNPTDPTILVRLADRRNAINRQSSNILPPGQAAEAAGKGTCEAESSSQQSSVAASQVFQSAANMADTYYWFTYLQQPTDNVTNEFIMDQYDILYRSYMADRSRIPADRLVEVGFSDLDSDPLGVLRRIYHQFGWDEQYNTLSDRFHSYVSSLGDFKKNHFNRLSPEVESVVRERWGDSFQGLGYT